MKNMTAQDGSGSTIAPRADRRVDLFFNATETDSSAARLNSISTARANDPEPCAGEEAVDADGPVDAQNAPTGPWKTADGFPQAPTAILVFLIKGESRNRHQARPRPAGDNYRVPLRSPAALPLLTLRRQK
jgi:hypothetical protein